MFDISRFASFVLDGVVCGGVCGSFASSSASAPTRRTVITRRRIRCSRYTRACPRDRGVCVCVGAVLVFGLDGGYIVFFFEHALFFKKKEDRRKN